jgi:succinoglycan biosynthesis transport protein ExoP
MSETTQVERPRPVGKPQLRPVAPKAAKGSEDTLDIREIMAVLRRRAKVIVGCAALISVLATIVVFQLTPRYTAEASVMLDVRKNQVVDVQSVLSGLQGDSAVLRSEVEILKSRTLAQKVADKLNLYAYAEFNPSRAPPNYLNALLHPLGPITQALRKLTLREGEIAADEQANEIARKLAVVRTLMGHVEITNDGRSYLLKIRTESEDPQLAAKIANAYVDVYLLDQLEAKFDAVRRATSWLNEHLTELRDKVRDSDRAVQLFKEQHNLTELRGGGTLTAQQLTDINSQLMIAAADRAQKESTLRQLQEQLKSGNVDASSVLGSPLVQRLREQEAELLRRQAELSTRYKPAHPTMVNLRAEIQDVKRKLDEEIGKAVRGMQSDVAAARAREAALRETLNGLQKNTSEQDKATVQLRELEREAEANKALYESFLAKFKQTSAQEDIQQADARLVSAATPPNIPSYPNKTMLLGFAVVIGILLGVSVAFLLERLDNGFRTSDQIEKLLGLGTLGLVPAVTRREPPQDVIVNHPTSQYSEAIRSVRTVLRYSDIDHPPKVVLVTSSLPGEGKTVFAASLARSVARSGGRALLIDCDLRRPGVARLLGVDAEPGLLGLFAEGANQESVIRVDPASGMHFIASKGGTANPQDLLGSQQMRAFLDRMRSRYDTIVIDAPPVLAVSDPIILSHVVDATMFLVRWEKTPRPVVAGAMKILRTNGGPVAGAVLSRVNARRHATYGYGDAAYYYGRYSDYYATNK